MKTVLFVIPSLKTGGTNSSLDALYVQLKESYSIHVLSISHQPRNHNYSFDEVLLKQNVVLSLLFSDFTYQKGALRVYAFLLKTIQSVSRVFGVNLGLFYAKRIVRKMESKTQYDYVVGFQEGYATKITSFFCNPNKIAWIHCNYDTYMPQGQSEEAMYSVFQKIVCVSEYTSMVFSRRYPSLSSRVWMINNLIDAEKIRNLANTSLDDPLFVSNGLTILSAGRFSSIKRFRSIPGIASNLKSRGLRFTWYILGPKDGSDEYVVYMNNLNKYDVQDCVVWLGNKSNPFPYFKAADLYVCLSESEACPMVFKEAKLFGLPIVTTDFPSSYEFINDGEGSIVPFENIVDAIETAMKKLMDGYCVHPSIEDSRELLERIHHLFD